MENYSNWIGKKEILEDYSDHRPIAMMQTLLNEENKSPADLPHLYHWLYFLPLVNGQDLAVDGHPKKGGFLPPIPFPKRMWAGSRLQFFKPIAAQKLIRRESEILKVELKHGKSGNMYFVTVQHSIYSDNELAIIEEQDIVYRDATNQVQGTVQPPAATVEAKAFDYKKSFPVDTVTLFRYSAVTFNGHRIHYDRPYATQEEGYLGLVVHGPLLATLLIHHFKQEHPDKKITRFEFRAVNPVFDFDNFQIYGRVEQENGELWIEKNNGQICMKAKISFKE